MRNLRYVKFLLAVFVLLASLACGKSIGTLGKECRQGDLRACRELVQIAVTDNKSGFAAVKELAGEAFLAEVARIASDKWVRLNAVSRLTDQSLLERIARSNSEFEVKVKAVEMLVNGDVLADIVRADPDMYIRRSVLTNPACCDPEVLAQLALHDREKLVRLAALENPRLSDLRVLVEIAEHDSDGEVRAAAARYCLADVAEKGYEIDRPTVHSGHCSRCGAAAYSDNLHCPACGASFSNTSREPNQVRLTTKDQIRIAELATKESWDVVRELAVAQLFDRALLKKIAKLDNSGSVRRMAEQRLFALERK